MKRVIAVLGIVALGLTAACSSGSKSKSNSSGGDCKASPCTGSLNGAAYQIRMPEHWNGTLLLWSHGYRQARPAPPDFKPVSTAPESAPKGTDELLSEGYALAGSAYATNGWAVPDGVRADQDLYSYFSSHQGKPQRVYVWGESLGGLITETLAEQGLPWITAAAPECGVLGGTNLTLDLALDATYAIKTLLIPDLKLTNYSSYDEAVANFNKIYKAVQNAPKDLANTGAKFLLIAAITDPSQKTKKFDGHDIVSRLTAELTVVTTAMGYGTFGRWEIEQRLGGDPSSNTFSRYTPRVSAQERAMVDQFAPGKADGWLAQLEQGQRVTADPAARSKAKNLGDPSGKVLVPTITMHTEYDDLVPVQEESVFAQRVARQGRPASVLQLYTKPPATYPQPKTNDPKAGAPYGAGHCNFTPSERIAQIHLLDSWVKSGKQPQPAAVRAAYSGPNGLDPGYRPAPWPAPEDPALLP